MRLVGAVLFALVSAVRPATAQPTAEVPLPRGHFYSQAGGDTARPDDGYLVADRPGFGFSTGRNFVRFWSEFSRYGGVQIVGYPASRPFVWDGFDVQVFQKGVFQWRPDQGPDGRAWFMNVFDEFTRRGLDQRLLAEKQIPVPGAYNDSGKSFEQIRSERMALLNSHPAFLQQYNSVPDPLSLYGLPNSSVQDFGPFFAVRLQRAAFQEWKVDAPGIARVGQVTVVNAGDAAKEFGLIPETARLPVAPPSRSSEQVAIFSPGVTEDVSSPFTVAGDARAFEATVLWELKDSQRGDLLGRGFTTAAECCVWASFDVDVPYAIPRALRATLNVWGASGRDAADRPGEVRVALELQDQERPAAARDNQRLIEPLRLRSEGGPGVWIVDVRVRNESGQPVTVRAAEIGLRNEANSAVEWNSAVTAWGIGAGESRDLNLRFESASLGSDAAGLRLLHLAGRPGSADLPPVVVDLPDLDTTTANSRAPTPSNQLQPVQNAIADAAQRARVEPAAVQVLEARATEWSDSSLGCPQPGMAYLQVITPGYLLVLRAAGRTLEYHTDTRGRVVLCAER